MHGVDERLQHMHMVGKVSDAVVRTLGDVLLTM
jgi:hypothetical protein